MRHFLLNSRVWFLLSFISIITVVSFKKSNNNFSELYISNCLNSIDYEKLYIGITISTLCWLIAIFLIKDRNTSQFKSFFNLIGLFLFLTCIITLDISKSGHYLFCFLAFSGILITLSKDYMQKPASNISKIFIICMYLFTLGNFGCTIYESDPIYWGPKCQHILVFLIWTYMLCFIQ